MGQFVVGEKVYIYGRKRFVIVQGELLPSDGFSETLIQNKDKAPKIDFTDGGYVGIPLRTSVDYGSKKK